MNDTRATILEKYHTHLRRDAATDPQMQMTLFRAFERTLGPWLPKDKNAAILDMACGEGAFLAFLSAQGCRNLSGFDLSPENVELCRQRGLQFVSLADANDIATYPGPNRGWDVIFCLDLIEHIPRHNAVKLLANTRTRLAPDGCLILQTLNMSYLAAQHAFCNDITHEWGYTESSARSLLSASGFESVEIRPAWNATTPLGRGRETFLALLHRLFYLCEGKGAPRIATRNLLIRAHPDKSNRA